MAEKRYAERVHELAVALARTAVADGGVEDALVRALAVVALAHPDGVDGLIVRRARWHAEPIEHLVHSEIGADDQPAVRAEAARVHADAVARLHDAVPDLRR